MQDNKDLACMKRAAAKAQAALEAAKEKHEAVLTGVQSERDKLDRRAKLERERWTRSVAGWRMPLRAPVAELPCHGFAAT